MDVVDVLPDGVVIGPGFATAVDFEGEVIGSLGRRVGAQFVEALPALQLALAIFCSQARVNKILIRHQKCRPRSLFNTKVDSLYQSIFKSTQLSAK